MGPEPEADQRWQRRVAVLFSAGLHGLFVLLLVWVALVRSAPQTSEPVQRVALRFVSAGQGHEHGQAEAPADASANAPLASPAGTPTTGDQQVARPVVAVPVRAPLPEPASSPAPVTDTSPAPLAAPPAAAQPELVAPSATVAATAPAVVQAPSGSTTLARQEPEQAPLLPAPPLRPIAARAVDFALEAEVSLPVVEHELELARQVQLRPAPSIPMEVAALALPEVRVAERPVELRQAAPAAGALDLPPVPAPRPAAADAGIAVREREVSVLQSAPSLSGVRQPAMSGRSPSVTATDLAVAEREISPAGAAPALRGLGPPAIAVNTATVGMPAVLERQVSGREPAPALAGVRVGQAGPEVSLPAASAPGVRERTVPDGGPVAGQAAAANGGNAASGRPAAAMAEAGSAQDWSRGMAGSDDWSRPGGADGRASGVAGVAAPPGLRVADLPAAAPVRGAPGGDNDQWTRQRLEAGGTWLRRPPPGHAPGRFDRYWVPNESLLAEWVRQGIKNVDIPLPGGSGSISCVISLLQLGGGCGVTDPNMQEQPARARAAPDIPFKPALHNDNGSH